MINLGAVKGAGAGGVAVLVGLAAFELGILGMQLLKNDGEMIAGETQKAIKPEECYAKTGFFAKKKAVRQSRIPFDERMVEIDHKPSNGKVIKINKDMLIKKGVI